MLISFNLELHARQPRPYISIFICVSPFFFYFVSFASSDSELDPDIIHFDTCQSKEDEIGLERSTHGSEKNFNGRAHFVT
jgi:hypothetical protein